jgi:phage terminase small subunit
VRKRKRADETMSALLRDPEVLEVIKRKLAEMREYGELEAGEGVI